MITGIIFDLDQTLIESNQAYPLRKNRNWEAVYKIIPNLYPYPEISELIKELKSFNFLICIVTSSPRKYCELVIKQWDWKIDATVCYHDTSKHKPHPEPIEEGLLRLGLEAKNVVTVGDSSIDIQAAKAAGVFSIGVLWGSLNKVSLEDSNPELLCKTVKELKEFLLSKKYRY